MKVAADLTCHHHLNSSIVKKKIAKTTTNTTPTTTTTTTTHDIRRLVIGNIIGSQSESKTGGKRKGEECSKNCCLGEIYCMAHLKSIKN